MWQVACDTPEMTEGHMVYNRDTHLNRDMDGKRKETTAREQRKQNTIRRPAFQIMFSGLQQE